MATQKENKESPNIMLSCYYSKNREGEHFVPEHTLQYSIAGTLVLNDGENDYPSHIGKLRFIKRNQLLKFTKQPPSGGEFRSLSIYLDQQMLKNFSLEYDIVAAQKYDSIPMLEINDHPLIATYMDSLVSYYSKAENLVSQQLLDIKLKEGILLLLQLHPELKNILFDFTEPHKINLEAFMHKNYHFNVKIERFAYLTGRSLATFKRDFEQIFNTSPGKWLQQKRLQEAYYLLTQKGKKASEIYLDLGFEDLSHFSYVFKKTYGKAPSRITM